MPHRARHEKLVEHADGLSRPATGLAILAGKRLTVLFAARRLSAFLLVPTLFAGSPVLARERFCGVRRVCIRLRLRIALPLVAAATALLLAAVFEFSFLDQVQQFRGHAQPLIV
jgi:hypothetical protein